MDVHRALIALIEDDKRNKKPALNQSQKVVALTLDTRMIQLWVDPMDQAAHASVMVNGHCENYRVDESGFESWVRAEYGRRHWVEMAGCRVPAVPNTTAIGEGVATIRARAQASGLKITPALRVGGDGKEFWLDLGTHDWELVKITPEGWQIVTNGVPGRVRFIRRPGMLPLPIPLKGGSIQALKPFYNVTDDFVLCVGWLLGALRPIGPTP
jgi:hypothetical protein